MFRLVRKSKYTQDIAMAYRQGSEDATNRVYPLAYQMGIVEGQNRRLTEIRVSDEADAFLKEVRDGS